MSKTEPLLVLLAILVLVSQVFSIPVDNPEPTTEEPVILPPEPLSKIVFVNDLPPEETLQFEFARGARVYVASSRDIEADSYEENIHIFAPNLDGESKKMSEVGRKVDSETGEKQPVFEDLRYSISIRNNNDEKSKTKNPGIIYFLLAPDDEHVSYVFESTRQEKRTIFIQSNNIENHYVTLLNPSGAVRITNIHNIDGLTALTVSAGGLEETKSSNFTIHDIGKDASQTVAPLFFVEPVLTFRKQLSLFPSSFEITAKGVEIQNQVVIPMKWSDWSLGMSPNYMLRNESNSFKYVFNSSIEDSQFDVQMFGEISADSSLTISYNGIEGAGSESFQKKHLKRLSKSLKAQSLTVEYKRAESDTRRGVLVRVECSQIASSLLPYSVLSMVFLRYIF